MIPRLRTPFSLAALGKALVSADAGSRDRFEKAFAARFGFPHAVSFQYGRSAVYALLKALAWKDREVLMPAYTCAVVAHAIKLSGNQPRFVDSSSDHFNVPSTNWSSVTPETAMAVVTPLFGYPVDRQNTEKAIREASPKTFLLYDMAHGFAVEDRAGSLTQTADAALYGLGIGKHISSLFGGMLLIRNPEVHQAVRAWRDANCRAAPSTRTIKDVLYGAAVWAAFREPLLSCVDKLENDTSLLYRFTDYYYGKAGPSLPDDFLQMPTPFQAALGTIQVGEYEQLEARRWATAQLYEARLAKEGFPLFARHPGATFSHFPLAVAQRQKVVSEMRAQGVQLGILVDYAIPDLPGYETDKAAFPHARFFGKSMVNLPVYPGISVRQVERVCDALCRVRKLSPDAFITAFTPSPAAESESRAVIGA